MKATVQVITTDAKVSSVTVEHHKLDVKAIVKKARISLGIAFRNIFQATITKLEG